MMEAPSTINIFVRPVLDIGAKIVLLGRVSVMLMAVVSSSPRPRAAPRRASCRALGQ